jgi:hypothetical protein
MCTVFWTVMERTAIMSQSGVERHFPNICEQAILRYAGPLPQSRMTYQTLNTTFGVAVQHVYWQL